MNNREKRENIWYVSRRTRVIAMILACVVTFSTTYALILPAITLEEQTAQEDPAIVLETPTPAPTEERPITREAAGSRS